MACVALRLAALACFCAPLAGAQNTQLPDRQLLVSVRVVTDSGAVLQQDPSTLPIQPGQPFSIEAEAASLRQLYRSGRYADLRAELSDVPGGMRLDFVVQQNFYVNRVQIEGLREPPGDAQALSALRLNVGEPFRDADMKEAVERLHQVLEDEGLYQSKIDYTTMPHPDTLQMDILVRVVTGARAHIGTVTTENETQFTNDQVRSHLHLKEGAAATAEILNRSADRVRKWLTDNDYLGARVTIHRGDYDRRSNRVPVQFVVYAGLEVRMKVEGAKISDGTLRRLVPIYQEGAVDDDLLQEGRRALRDYFERQGYFDTQVSYTVAEAPAGESGTKAVRVARLVTYHVDRGEHHRLAGVDFTGNHYFSSDQLTTRLAIQPAGYASPGRYSSDLVQGDVASIRTLYNSNGFRDCKVESQLEDNYRGREGDLFIRFHIEEGPQTVVAGLTIEGNHQLSTDELLSVVGSSQGQPYSEFNVSSDRDNILALYYDQGFSDATFTADVETTGSGARASPAVHLTYRVTEGNQVRVARVLLSGYEHTRRGVISREVGIRAGQPLSERSIVETQRRLYNLGIFSRVVVAPQNPDGDEPEKTVVVMVDEARRYTIAYGLGFEVQRIGTSGAPVNGSLMAAPRATLEVTKANLTGRADSLTFKARASTIQGRALLAYTAPNYFGDPNFSLQMQTYYESLRDVQTFDSRTAEASIGLSQKLSPTSTMLYRYAYRHVVASNLQLGLTQEQLPLFRQNTEVSEFETDWLRDHRDSPADPTTGDFETVDVALALKPLGSSADFIHVYLQNSTYHHLGRRLVFARSTRFGVQTPFGNSISGQIPLPERFFAGGGTSLRGFGLNQAGPRDPLTGYPIGGQAMLIFNQDLRFPMHLPLIGNRLGGAVFYDAGNVFPSIRKITFRTAPVAPVFSGTNASVCLSNCTNELAYFSHTVGFEFRYGTPVGPIAIDLGYQLNAPQFLVPTACPAGVTASCSALTKLTPFQFFFNLGTTF